MDKLIVVVLLLGLIALCYRFMHHKLTRGGGCCGEQEAPLKKVKVADRNKDHYPYLAKLKIDGMVCENCARRVENALNSEEGTWARADFLEHEALVRTKEKPQESKLKKTVADAGYTVVDIEYLL